MTPARYNKSKSHLSKGGNTFLSISDIGPAQGINDKFILGLAKDRNGNIWIGTNTTLYRFDGEYTSRYDYFSTGVAGIIEDDRGRIWCINSRGIFIVDIRTGTVKASSKLTTTKPRDPKMIKDEKGNIWVTHIDSKGAAVINPGTETFKMLNQSTGLSGTNRWGVFCDQRKNIWLTGNGGANIITPDGKIKFLRKASGIGSDTLYAINGDKNE